MTNAPEGRKTHVVRLIGTNGNKEVLKDIWVDVERIDSISIRTQTSLPQFNIENQYQEVEIQLEWRDDPNGDNYIAEDDLSADANTGRVHELVKVCDPESTDNFNNPDEWVAVKTILHISMDQKGIGTSEKRFVAESIAANRKVNPRRFYHYDTNIDDNASSAFDGGAKSYVVSGEKYQRNDSSKDDGQYVEHEVIEYLEKHVNDETFSTGGTNQEVQFKLKNQYLIDESEPATLAKTGPDNRNPPYRLDPFQNIINAKFKLFGAIAVMVTQSNNVTYYKKTNKSEVGDFQSLGILDFTENGAVRGCSYAKVTTGSPPKSEPIFLLCGDTGGTESILTAGIIMVSNDGLHWTTTASVSGGFRFLRMTWNPDDKAFFAELQSFHTGDFTTITCWTSTNGHSWAEGGDDFESHLKYDAEDGQYGFDPSKGTDGHLVLATDLNVGNLTFAGGVWFKSGFADGESGEPNLYESVDDVNTWQFIKNFGSGSGIFPLIAGAWQDVKAWQAAHG